MKFFMKSKNKHILSGVLSVATVLSAVIVPLFAFDFTQWDA